METMPQAKVRTGSHIFGVTFFNTRLLGISLPDYIRSDFDLTVLEYFYSG